MPSLGQTVALLVLFTFLPPLLFVWRLRSAERSGREPWDRILVAFLWGAVAAVLLSTFGEALFLSATDGFPFALALVVAPVVEETSKAIGLLFFRDRSPEPENGYVYGGAVGLGFAATENLVYVGGAYFLGGDTQTALVLGLYRGVATTALHAAATAIAGYGLWRLRFGPRRWVGVVLFPLSLAVAILVHATYNTLASIESLYGVILAVLFALAVFGYVRRRVRAWDRRGA